MELSKSDFDYIVNTRGNKIAPIFFNNRQNAWQMSQSNVTMERMEDLCKVVLLYGFTTFYITGQLFWSMEGQNTRKSTNWKQFVVISKHRHTTEWLAPSQEML